MRKVGSIEQTPHTHTGQAFRKREPKMGQANQLSGAGLHAQLLPPPPLDEYAGSSPPAIFILSGIRASKDLGLAWRNCAISCSSRTAWKTHSWWVWEERTGQTSGTDWGIGWHRWYRFIYFYIRSHIISEQFTNPEFSFLQYIFAVN